MDIERFMQGYKAAWEQRDPAMFAALFLPDGSYHNTPFQVQRGTAQLVEYWKRVQLQEDVRVSFEILASAAEGLALVPEPFEHLARKLGVDADVVIDRLRALREGGAVKRLGLVVRHHELGFRANAMVVWDIPDHETERVAARFVSNESVTLCYERPRRPNWR